MHRIGIGISDKVQMFMQILGLLFGKDIAKAVQGEECCW